MEQKSLMPFHEGHFSLYFQLHVRFPHIQNEEDGHATIATFKKSFFHAVRHIPERSIVHRERKSWLSSESSQIRSEDCVIYHRLSISSGQLAAPQPCYVSSPMLLTTLMWNLIFWFQEHSQVFVIPIVEVFGLGNLRWGEEEETCNDRVEEWW